MWRFNRVSFLWRAALCAVALAAFTVAPRPAIAQQQSAAPAADQRAEEEQAAGARDIRAVEGRSEIGLALSGGGARGGAHIGVLKALEELRVPVDYIAGTSIGAVVGGFYASGRSVAELEDLVENIDWESAFLNITPRQLRSFRRKRDDDSFLVKQRPGLNEGELELPIGLVQGQVIDLIIAQFTLPASGVDDFDELPIPFRAVAADIATGDAVILREGNLARAVRASMALPAALAPVEIDNQLLVDGGIAMNLPVEVARDMGSDVVIAVDISAALRSREALRSVVDVTTQLTNLLTREGVERQREMLGREDVLLQPQFSEELSSVDFERMGDAIEAGYAVVMQHREELEPYALSPTEYAAHIASRTDPTMHELPIIDFVRLENRSEIADSVIEARLREVVVGERLTLETVEKAINQAYGLELFQNVRYRVVSEGERTGLEVEIVPRSWGPNYLQLGMSYSSSEGQDALFGLAASYLRTAINPKGGEWRATFVVGDEPALTADLYQPLGTAGLYFIEPSLSFESNQYNVFGDDEEELLAEARLRETTFEVAFGRELPIWGEARAGVRGTVGDTELRVGEPIGLPNEEYQRGEVFARFSVDTLDNIAFPRSGLLATAEWRGSRPDMLSADADYDQLLISAAHAKTWGRHTLLSTLRYDVTLSGDTPLDRAFRMGGFLDLSGFSQNQLTGQHAARIGASYYRRIGDLTLFPAFAGVSIEYGNVWDERNDISFDGAVFGGSLWAGVDTPVGPIFVGYGMGEGGLDAFYVYLGRVF